MVDTADFFHSRLDGMVDHKHQSGGPLVELRGPERQSRSLGVESRALHESESIHGWMSSLVIWPPVGATFRKTLSFRAPICRQVDLL